MTDSPVQTGIVLRDEMKCPKHGRIAHAEHGYVTLFGIPYCPKCYAEWIHANVNALEPVEGE